MNEFESTAITAAMEAGKLQRDNYSKHNNIFYKGRINLVTEINIESERIIKNTILKRFPDHSIMAEESEEKVASTQYKWIIDPLDGTTNFAHGYPCFCISIALEKDGDIILGVIFDAVKKELFTAKKGEGAFLNGEKISVSKIDKLTESLLVTGFPYDIRENPDNNLNYFFAMSMAAQAVRRDGAAALDLAYIACGRFDGFWELKLAPWDIAAGILMVEEAGGTITGLKGQPITLLSQEILASNSKIHAEMMEVIEENNRPGK
ncbi:inositol monophosphatase [Candidatus Desantisbacteria bacterium]|nr:inositol monophosphatase [Candidatus Desantisbacteria bacterium]